MVYTFYHRVRLFHHTACLVLYQICMEVSFCVEGVTTISDVPLLCFYPVQDPVAKVISIQRKSKSKWRPVALDTVVSNHAIAQFVQFYMILFVRVV